ncbi:MAG: hypothetical protein ACLQKA_02560 [Bryobacteraceae bacterium]
MKTVGVDFNMIASPGVVLASPSFASAQLNRGDLVVAVDFDDPQLRYFAFVEDFDRSGLARLKIEARADWSSSFGGIVVGRPSTQPSTTGNPAEHKALTLSVPG